MESLPDGNRWKIVVIDDEADIREVMALTLEDAGYAVWTACDGQSGLELCNDILPQIVITDIRMPRMTGLQVLENLKKSHPDTEIIVVTAFGEMNLAIRALQLDASDFITKPINDQALHLALKRAGDRYLARKQISDHTALLEREKARTIGELIKTISFRNNLIEHSMDGIVGCDESEQVVIYNQSMERLLGIPKADVLNRMTLEQLFTPDAAQGFRKEFSGSRFGGPQRLYLYETELMGRQNRKIPVQVSAAALGQQDREDGLVCFFRDLRELRRLEREMADQARILHQDKMISLGRLAASVAHEINNPLSGILNYLRLMIRIMQRNQLSADRREKFHRYLTLVEAETSRCSEIVSSLLTFSRKTPAEVTDVRVDQLLQRCLLLSRHKLELSNIALEAGIPPGLPRIKADFNQLQQCIINLIFNAIDAMPDGGKLTLTSQLDDDRRRLKISVKDTGRGIDREVLPHIFEPFFTTKKEGYGVGLGLSTVYGIVQRYLGTVTVDSPRGGGTAITLSFPC